MKTLLPKHFLVASAFAAMCLVFWNLSSPSPTAAQQPAKRQTWEYHVETVGAGLDTGVLNGLGNEGWELVTAMKQPPTNAPTDYVFKRPK